MRPLPRRKRPGGRVPQLAFLGTLATLPPSVGALPGLPSPLRKISRRFHVYQPEITRLVERFAVAPPAHKEILRAAIRDLMTLDTIHALAPDAITYPALEPTLFGLDNEESK